MYNFVGVEKHLIRKGLLRFSLSFKAAPSIEQTITDILNIGSDNVTYYASGKHYCGIYDYRTVSDIFRILKHYHSEVTLEQTYETLYKLGNSGMIHSWICNTIHKRVYFLGYKGYTRFNVYEEDEYGFKFKKMRSIQDIYFNPGYNTSAYKEKIQL